MKTYTARNLVWLLIASAALLSGCVGASGAGGYVGAPLSYSDATADGVQDAATQGDGETAGEDVAQASDTSGGGDTAGSDGGVVGHSLYLRAANGMPATLASFFPSSPSYRGNVFRKGVENCAQQNNK